MDVSTILISVAGIVATGSLSRAGATITDNVLLASKQLLALIQNKLPHIADVLQNNKQPVDYSHVYTEIKAIAKKEPQTKELLQKMEQAVLNDGEVAQVVEYELNKPSSNLQNVIENWQGINIKGGINSITGNTFTF